MRTAPPSSAHVGPVRAGRLLSGGAARADAGPARVQVVQLFDSWAHHLSPDQYAEFSLPYAEHVVAAVRAARPGVSLIYHANGGAPCQSLLFHSFGHAVCPRNAPGVRVYAAGNLAVRALGPALQLPVLPSCGHAVCVRDAPVLIARGWQPPNLKLWAPALQCPAFPSCDRAVCFRHVPAFMACS